MSTTPPFSGNESTFLTEKPFDNLTLEKLREAMRLLDFIPPHGVNCPCGCDPVVFKVTPNPTDLELVKSSDGTWGLPKALSSGKQEPHKKGR